MLKRNTFWFVGLLLSLMASHTLGLGLGSVTVESYLNQPLRLRIEILQLGETRIEDVTVQMASTDDFARFGIERVGVLSSVACAERIQNFRPLYLGKCVRRYYRFMPPPFHCLL